MTKKKEERKIDKRYCKGKLRKIHIHIEAIARLHT